MTSGFFFISWQQRQQCMFSGFCQHNVLRTDFHQIWYQHLLDIRRTIKNLVMEHLMKRIIWHKTPLTWRWGKGEQPLKVIITNVKHQTSLMNQKKTSLCLCLVYKHTHKHMQKYKHILFSTFFWQLMPSLFPRQMLQHPVVSTEHRPCCSPANKTD